MSTFNLPPQLIFKGNGGAHPPHGNITATDHGPVVVAFSWIFYSLTGMTVLVRLISRRNFAPDYWCVLAGFILLTLDSVTIHLAAHKGLGRHIATLSTGDLSQYNRAFYAGQILKVLILALSKISYLTIFTRLLLEASGRRKTIRIFCYSMIGVISAWAFATSMALALQCDTPHPWTFIGNKCVDQAVLYYLTGAFNIATDVVIVVIPAVIVLDIQLGRNKKAAVVAIFATRILVPPFAIVELALLPQYFDRADPTWYNATVAIWGQAMLNFSLLMACIPSIKPFLTTLQFSLIDTSVLPFSVPGGTSDNNSKSSGNGLLSFREKSSPTPKLGSSSSERYDNSPNLRLGNITDAWHPQSC